MGLVYDQSKCIGCKLCQLACSVNKEGEFNRNLSRLQVDFEHDSIDMHVNTKICDLCLVCIDKCPVDAIEFKDGYLHFDEDKCVGCRLCIKACPQNVIVERERKPLLCDLCGGDPECIKWCPHEALVYQEGAR